MGPRDCSALYQRVIVESDMEDLGILFVDADEMLKARVLNEWGELQARHMHLVNGFSIVAMQENILVGLISVAWKLLPAPLSETREGFIDIIEVHQDFRRKGIARRLVDLSLERAEAEGAYQVRAWSSSNKVEAIPMWKALGFCLCPATVYPRGQEVTGCYVVKQSGLG